MSQVGGRKVLDEAGRLVYQPFKFSAVNTLDDAKNERVEKDAGVAKNLGTIEILFHRAFFVGETDGFPFKVRPQAQSPTLELAEKALKGRAISHGTRYITHPKTPTAVKCSP